MSCFTLVMPYYENPAMLAEHYREWETWPDALRSRFSAIVVDDGSAGIPAASVSRPTGLEIAIYRLLGSQPWRQHAARNLGAALAEPGWLLLTDIDHLLPQAGAAGIVGSGLDAGTVYVPSRVDASTGLPTVGRDGKPKPHPNTFLMTREMFWRIGGYDERATGVYGTDRLFRERCVAQARVAGLDIRMVRYGRKQVADASTTGLSRDLDDPARLRAIAAIQADPLGRTTLQFAWERVC